MKMLEKLLNLVAPEACVSCGKEGLPLCEPCQLHLEYQDQCYRCKKPSAMSLTCDACRKHTRLSALYCVASYKDEAKQLIINIKYGSSRPTSTFVGRLLANKLPYLPGEDVIVTHIPTTPARIRERSFDQSQRIAKAMSASVHLTYARLLYRKTKSHQVGFTRAQRQEHMKQAFGVLHASLIKGKTVLLVDDVLTTGSTLESAAKELKNAGAKRVIGAVFARTE